MPDLDSQNSIITELTDVQVDTLGLVTQGANREEFFLLKSADKAMEPEQNLWTRFMKLFQKTVNAEMAELEKQTEAEAPEPPKVVEPKVVLPETSGSMTVPPGEDSTETSSTPLETVSVNSVFSSTPVEITESVETPTSHLEATTMDDTVEKTAQLNTQLESRLAELEKANATLVAEVEKAREERDRETYIAKANSFAAIPVAPSELGEQLHALAKWDAKRLTFWTDLLKSVDALASDAELYIEKGTAYTAEQPDALTVIAKAEDPKAEILKLSSKDAAAYIKSVRARAKSAQEG